MKPLGLLLICLLVISTFLFTISANAQTTTVVNGILEADTTWTKAGSPYELTGPVGVKEGVTLTIEAGTIVYCNHNYIQVNGTLTAKGTSSQRIILDSAYVALTRQSTSWNEATNQGNILEYCNITFTMHDGQPKYSYSLTIEGVSVRIANSNVSSINVIDASPIITDGNDVGSIYVDGSPRIIGNTIRGITIYSGSPVIAYNVISGNIKATGSPTICNNNISYSTFSSTTPIIQLIGNGIIANNYLTGLRKMDSPSSIEMGLGPITVYYGIEVSGDTLISNNNITGCTRASIVVSSGNPTIQQNNLNAEIRLNSGTAKINYNNINSGVILSESISADIDATNNWWGTANTTLIDTLIHDNKDDFNLAHVNYTPFLTVPNSQAQPDLNAPIPTTLPTPTASTNPTPTKSESPQTTFQPTVNPNETSELPITGNISLLGFDWEITVIIILVTVIAALLVITSVLIRKRKA